MEIVAILKKREFSFDEKFKRKTAVWHLHVVTVRVRNVILLIEKRAAIIIDRARYTLLTLITSSVATPSVSSLQSTTTYEIGGSTTITLKCMTTTDGVTYSWKDDGVPM